MTRMKAEEAERFYEEDEDPAEVFATFEAAVKGQTAPPGDERPTPRWPEKIRHQVAAALRRVANLIESPHMRAR
jgi:4-alpha-glucanotransferase